MRGYDDPPNGIGRARTPCCQSIARYLDAAEQLGSLQPMEIQWQGFYGRRRRGLRRRLPGWSGLPDRRKTGSVRLDFTGDFGHEVGILKISTNSEALKLLY